MMNESGYEIITTELAQLNNYVYKSKVEYYYENWFACSFYAIEVNYAEARMNGLSVDVLRKAHPHLNEIWCDLFQENGQIKDEYNRGCGRIIIFYKFDSQVEGGLCYRQRTKETGVSYSLLDDVLGMYYGFDAIVFWNYIAGAYNNCMYDISEVDKWFKKTGFKKVGDLELMVKSGKEIKI